MNFMFSLYWIMIVGVWYFANGILHDIFVLIRHKEGYNRDLLRLLMDGHVLALSGIILGFCYFMMRQNIVYGAWISIVIGIFMLIYCAMIWPFLKSMVTVTLSIMLIIVSIKALNSMSINPI
jgi:hypothetical protein